MHVLAMRQLWGYEILLWKSSKLNFALQIRFKERFR